MKKSLENELMSLAHRVLQLSGRDDLEEMKALAGTIYERLCILSFAEKHFEGPQPTIGLKEVKEALEQEPEAKTETEQIPVQPKTKVEETNIETQENTAEETTPVPKAKKESPKEEEASLPKEKEIKEESAPTPVVEKKPEPAAPLEVDSKPEKEVESASSEPQESTETEKIKLEEEEVSIDDIDFRDIAVHFDDLPQFEPLSIPKPEAEQPETPASTESEPVANQEEKPTEKAPSKPQKRPITSHVQSPDLFSAMRKTKNDPKYHKPSLNETIKRGLGIGLNDRHAFIKNLFDGNQTDFSRVISQLNTFENYEEAKTFIEEQVKPDYDWKDKEEYEERFYHVIEKKMTNVST